MNLEKARKIVKEAAVKVDWYNLGSALDMLSRGCRWHRYKNDKWLPEYSAVEQDTKWLIDNLDELTAALIFLRKNFKLEHDEDNNIVKDEQ